MKIINNREEMGMKDKNLKLKIELVPSTSWYNNLRNYMSKDDWDKIRKQTYAKYNYRCGICGGKGRLNCHEVWEYDDKNNIQKLVDFIALCDLCHHVKHIGFVSILARRGELDYEEVVNHFMKVNGCDRATFEKYRRKVFTKWRERSMHKWEMDLGEYENVIEGR
jgi:hypothetical protein